MKGLPKVAVWGARRKLSRAARLFLAVGLLLLALAVASVAYADHPAPPLSAAVSLTNKDFKFDSVSYKGGHTVTGGAAGEYSWSLTAAKARHIFEVEEVGGDEISVTPPGDKQIHLAPGSTVTATFSLVCGKTYKVYCLLHEKSGASFKLVTSCP